MAPELKGDTVVITVRIARGLVMLPLVLGLRLTNRGGIIAGVRAIHRLAVVRAHHMRSGGQMQERPHLAWEHEQCGQEQGPTR